MFFAEHRRKPRGLADLLNWAALVADGVVLNKDGSFLAGWGFRGPDLEAATDEGVSAIAGQLNRALLSLGNEWTLWVDAVRRPAPEYPAPGAFPDPVTESIDRERREAYEREGYRFETRCVLTLAYLPPEELEARARRLVVTGEPEPKTSWPGELERFRAQLADFDDLLGAVFEVERLGSAALLGHLHFCLTGLDHPVAVPETPSYLDAVLSSADFSGGFRPRVGRRRIAPVALRGLPSESRPAMLSFLDRLAVSYRWSTRWLPLDPHTAERHLRRYRMRWWQKRKGLTGFLADLVHKRHPADPRPRPYFANRDAVAMAEDADAALGEASGQGVRFGYYTAVVVLSDDDEERLEESVRRVTKELRNAGFPAQLETVNAIEAWRGSLPGHSWPNVRRPMIHTRNLVDLLPVTAVWSGHRTHPSPLFPAASPPLLVAATGTTPFRLNLHSADVGHTLVVGPTGSGKSTLLGLLAAQFFRYPGAQVVFFDKGYSAYPLVTAAGGRHYDLAAEAVDRLSFYPLEKIDGERERAWAGEWLEVLFELQGVDFTPSLRFELASALTALASTPSRTLSELSLQLQSRRLRDALHPYTLRGALGRLLDASADGLADSRFQVFEVSHLLELRQKVVVPVLLYLFHRIEQRLDGRPTLLILDEAWTFLLDELFAQKIHAWLKELRKKNGAVVFATQSLADVRRSPERFVVYESCPTKIFLPNPEAGSEHGRELYREIGLNRREIEIVAGAVPKRDYYFTCPEGRRLVDLDLGPLALAFLGAADRESLRRIRELETASSRGWPGAWLDERGLAAQALAYRELLRVGRERTASAEDGPAELGPGRPGREGARPEAPASAPAPPAFARTVASDRSTLDTRSAS